MSVFLIFCLNCIQWYDYALYGIFSNSATNWLIYALGYIVAPIGGFFLAIIVNRFSYYYAMMIATFGMLFSSVIFYIYLLYWQNIDVEFDIILLIVRSLYGLCIGGIMALSFVELLNRDEYDKGYLASLPVLAIAIGFLFAVLFSKLIRADIIQYDNAILFQILLLCLIGISLLKYDNQDLYKMNLLDSRVDHQNEREVNVFKILYEGYMSVICSWRSIMSSCAISSVSAIGCWLSNYIVIIESDLIGNHYFIIFLIVSVVPIISGILCNNTDIIRYFYVLAFLLGMSNIYIFYLYAVNRLNIFVILIHMLLVYMYMGAEALIHNLLYRPKHINIAMVISFNLGVCIFGVTTPIILTGLDIIGNLQYILIYLAFILSLCIYSIAHVRSYKN
ncbi:MAG: hypothetical protein AAFO15_01315 [Pseudomonadota bacterium]